MAAQDDKPQPATPRTDAEAGEAVFTETGCAADVVNADFARQLERELAEAKEDLAKAIANHAADLTQSAGQHSPTHEQVEALRDFMREKAIYLSRDTAKAALAAVMPSHALRSESFDGWWKANGQRHYVSEPHPKKGWMVDVARDAWNAALQSAMASRDDALEEAAKLCESIAYQERRPNTYPSHGAEIAANRCAQEIRALRRTRSVMDPARAKSIAKIEQRFHKLVDSLELDEKERMVLGKFISIRSQMAFDSGLRIGITAHAHLHDKPIKDVFGDSSSCEGEQPQ